MNQDVHKKDLVAQTNASWLYEKAYFWGIDWSQDINTERNQHKLKTKNEGIQALRPDTTAIHAIGNHQLRLTTTYPGLLSGSGYIHELGIEGELKLGFSFDYTTGLPYIPGSSVKGRLRACFRDKDYHAYTLQLLGMITDSKLPSSEAGDEHPMLEQLEMEIFAAMKLEKRPTKDKVYWEYVPFAPLRKDIFYDAFAIASSHQGPDSYLNGGMLGMDYLTPHLDREELANSPFVNPIPLSFLKVLPGVDFLFDFKLYDSRLWPDLTAAKKREFFREILLDLGIGAKTNVGYGSLEDKSLRKRVKWPPTIDPVPPEPKADWPENSFGELAKANRSRKGVPARVLSIEGKTIKVGMILKGEKREFTFDYPAPHLLTVGKDIQVKVKQMSSRDGKKPLIFEFGKLKAK